MERHQALITTVAFSLSKIRDLLNTRRVTEALDLANVTLGQDAEGDLDVEELENNAQVKRNRGK